MHTDKTERKKILMPEENRKLLKELYLIRSYSGFEEPIRRGIMNFLDSLKIPYINFNGNILGFNHPGEPLFSAHMDMVNTEGYKLRGDEYRLDENHVFTIDNDTCIRLYRGRDNEGKPNQQTSLGADDKNGIWVILSLLQMGKNINFAFCHSEESGGEGSRQIVSDEECAKFIAGCAYGIIIDRRNAGDIIGYDNNYCLCLDDRLKTFSDEHNFGYKPVRGSISDADRFSALVECVNLSCGYYEPHTSREYTNLNELWNTFNFCVKILEDFKYISASEKRMQEYKKISAPYKKETTTSITVTPKVQTTSYASSYDTYTRYSRPSRVSTTSSVDLKKNLKKATTTQIDTKTTGITGTDIDATTEDMLEYINGGFLDKEEIAERAKDEDAYFDHDFLCWIVPLYPEDSKHLPGSTTSHDAVEWFKCDKCGKHALVLESTLDTIITSDYTFFELNGISYKILGICTDCYEVQDITEELLSTAFTRYI